LPIYLYLIKLFVFHLSPGRSSRLALAGWNCQAPLRLPALTHGLPGALRHYYQPMAGLVGYLQEHYPPQAFGLLLAAGSLVLVLAQV
jgi:hypothetical protein